MDQFPSAFDRFEDQVDISQFEDFGQLKRAFARWAGYKWIPTVEQERALRIEAEKRGLFHPREEVHPSEIPTVFVLKRIFIHFRGHRYIRYRNMITGRFVSRQAGRETYAQMRRKRVMQ